MRKDHFTCIKHTWKVKGEGRASNEETFAFSFKEEIASRHLKKINKRRQDGPKKREKRQSGTQAVQRKHGIFHLLSCSLLMKTATTEHTKRKNNDYVEPELRDTEPNLCQAQIKSKCPGKTYVCRSCLPKFVQKQPPSLWAPQRTWP